MCVLPVAKDIYNPVYIYVRMENECSGYPPMLKSMFDGVIVDVAVVGEIKINFEVDQRQWDEFTDTERKLFMEMISSVRKAKAVL